MFTKSSKDVPMFHNQKIHRKHPRNTRDNKDVPMIKDVTEIQETTRMFLQSRCTQDQMKIYLELEIQNKRMTKQKEKGTSQCLHKKRHTDNSNY